MSDELLVGGSGSGRTVPPNSVALRSVEDVDAFLAANSDSLEELDAEIAAENPELPALIDAAIARRRAGK